MSFRNIGLSCAVSALALTARTPFFGSFDQYGTGSRRLPSFARTIQVFDSKRDVLQVWEVIEARGLDPEQFLDPLPSAPAPIPTAHRYLLRASTWAASSRSFFATSLNGQKRRHDMFIHSGRSITPRSIVYFFGMGFSLESSLACRGI